MVNVPSVLRDYLAENPLEWARIAVGCALLAVLFGLPIGAAVTDLITGGRQHGER